MASLRQKRRRLHLDHRSCRPDLEGLAGIGRTHDPGPRHGDERGRHDPGNVGADRGVTRRRPNPAAAHRRQPAVRRGSGPVNVDNIGSPARLLIDRQQTSPSVVNRGTRRLIVRYHVSACGGRSVKGALVYATAVPFNQLTIPAERKTGSDGWAELDFRMLAGFPVSPKQRLIAIFARARKPGENPLGGISTRRLFSVHVNLHG